MEKVCHLKDLQKEKFTATKVPNEEYLLWATTSPGLYMSRKNYEVLETYGDTALKLTATMLAYWYKRNDRKAGEGDIENAKVCFITNFHLFRVGNHQMFQRWMRSKKDLEYKDWLMPLQSDINFPGHPRFVTNRCVGKNVTDAVEALTCSLYLSTKCFKSVLEWINDIKLVPIRLAVDIFDKFNYDVDYTFRHYKDLDLYDMKTTDTVKDIFVKYFKVEQVG